MRVFLAVPCGEDFRARLSTALDPLRDAAGVRWSPPAQYHLTLAFLGEWPENRARELQEALDSGCRPPAFSLDEPRWGAFPSLAAPRVLFVHWEDDAPLRNLAETVRRQVQSCWPDSTMDRKPFHGHLTVGRVRHRLAPQAGSWVRGFALPGLPSVAVEEFRLIRSVRKPQGAEHTVIDRYSL